MKDEMQQVLLERIQQYDQTALAEVYDRYFDQIYRYIYYRISDSEAAADIASEVFFALITAMKKGKPPRTSLLGWLYTVARNLTADYIKKKGRTVPLIDEIVSDERELSDHAHWVQMIPALNESFSQLTDEQQHVIALRFGLGMSLAETAKLLEKTVGSIKSLQHRALASLARMMPSQEVNRDER
ncbi:sigma-70 family RNA polymerase sigma factor [Anaerolineales bacterium HSG6]|nr:sigma-70 family RNA polymerase sigma factor [Anaerolineales bacterium HSG6]